MTTTEETTAPDVARAKPRLVLMGEFSSGKSTLSNILLGGPTLPVQVTATRLPPVHVSFGEPGACAITRDGQRVEVDLADLGHLTPDSFRSLHVTMISDTLELCDLVDMPGISDPNMPADTWDSVLRPGDHVIWCTHATQAWRQSEAAMWERMREAAGGVNLLLITQFDKLRNPRDRARVLNRVQAETAGQFAAVFPVCLLDALEAGEDFEAWAESGANAFMERLVEILMSPPSEFPEAASLACDPLLPAEAPHDFAVLEPDFSAAVPPDVRIVPRRVQARPGGSRLERLPQSARTEFLGAPMEPGVF